MNIKEWERESVIKEVKNLIKEIPPHRTGAANISLRELERRTAYNLAISDVITKLSKLKEKK